MVRIRTAAIQAVVRVAERSMTFRRAQCWVWWLLPFLVARALVPVGFMAQMSEGQFRLVFCTAGMAQTLNAGAATDHAADKSTGHQGSATQADFSCPFSQVAAVPLLDISGSEAIPFISSAEVLPPAESPYYAAGPPRRITNRGPPAHA